MGIDKTSGTRVTKNLWRQSPIDQAKMERRRKTSVLEESTNTGQWLFWVKSMGLGNETEALYEGHGSSAAMVEDGER